MSHKINIKVINDITRLIAKGLTYQAIGDKLGRSKGAIHYIVKEYSIPNPRIELSILRNSPLTSDEKALIKRLYAFGISSNVITKRVYKRFNIVSSYLLECRKGNICQTCRQQYYYDTIPRTPLGNLQNPGYCRACGKLANNERGLMWRNTLKGRLATIKQVNQHRIRMKEDLVYRLKWHRIAAKCLRKTIALEQ